ncbi:apolipoprotein B-100 [Lampris incognitus]|uniref:apolipoprotein B-100 n=1 Tax=Lampris incognitus TaxID=2546036 RepID=UPI0024B5918C|nr:apolipoprotein B-100 [Lampris incognitus]
MGGTTACLLLLLGSFASARKSNDHDEQTAACLLATKFKAYKKYVYQYTTESSNGVMGTADLRNGPKVTCQVELEVPQTCSFILHTRDCVLTEVSITDPQGQPVYRQAASSQAFQAAMERKPLRFTVEQVTTVQLYPDPHEPVNILNIKRGIVSALMAPVIEEDQHRLGSTMHGLCLTNHRVNARKDIAIDVSLSRDLSQCDQFYSRAMTNSPLALLQGLHYPMSKLIRSTHDCNYQFDNRRKHMTTAECTEKHIYIPFSHEDNGISSIVKQSLTLKSSERINSRYFVVDPSHRRPLHFEEPEDKAPVQTKDATLSTLRDLLALAGTGQGQMRASLFHELVTGLRVLRNETLSQTVKEMLDVSGLLTWQALLQCGTPECTSAILQAIRTVDGMSVEVDALVYGLSLKANPDAHHVRDLLSMAQFKQSKAIMYALANTVKKFHKGVTSPEVTDVSKFMETLLQDCSEDTEMTFLSLRVVGVMGQAMKDVSPRLVSSLLRCVKNAGMPLSYQKAAIQAFRQMDIETEVRKVLMEVYHEVHSPVEKRVAAYLTLMKNPDQALVTELVKSLADMADKQLASFVVSHLSNIRLSNEPRMQVIKKYIEMALTDQLSHTNIGFISMSRNYKLETPLASAQGNIIFDPTNTMPKEIMLETTLKVFDYNFDIFEVGIEGQGFEPTIDALFGEKGFFPDSISRALYWAGDNGPETLKRVWERIAPDRGKMKRQVTQDFLKDVKDHTKRLLDAVHSSPAPEAAAYLKLLGHEIGYIKTSEMRQMADTLFMYYHTFFRVLPAKAFHTLTSSTANELFAHYIFMENAFSLPTASGFPLKFSLAGVFTPGAKGGLNLSPGMQQLSFMPSVNLEFITQMGVHIPDFVLAGIEMHANIYHESSLNAKVTINRNQIKLSIPGPTAKTQLLSFSNKLLSVSSGRTKIVPSMVEDRSESTDCKPLFTGLKYCTTARYSNASSGDQAPYYPLTGETRFAFEILPTGKVSEYTASITGETLREGKDGRHKVDSLKLTLKAEGAESTEAIAALKYNRNKKILTSEVVIPDYNVEAGIKLAVTDTNAKGKKMQGITIDVTNRNIPQLTLVGRTRLEMMKDAMLQIQMVIPSIKTDASLTATLKKDEGVVMGVETVINMPQTSCLHKATLKYDDDKFEAELHSDLNSEIQKMIPNVENYHRHLQQLIDDILDQKVAKTDMKLRHIVTKGLEAGTIWLDKLAAGLPFVVNMRNRRSISELALPSLPDHFFLQSDSLFRYQFNKDKMAISLPLPLGGKAADELNIPTTLSIPQIHLPKIGLHIPAKNYPVPSFTIPQSLDLIIPLLGLAEASTKINTNFYNWESSISGGNTTIDVPSYIVQYKVMAQSPINLLSYKLEGAGMTSGRVEDNLKYLLNGSFSHSLLDASFSVSEALSITDKINARANYKVEASSPIGLHTSFYYSAKSASISDEVTGDGTLDGSVKMGSLYTNVTYTHSYTLHPLVNEGSGESHLHINSPFIQAHNMIHGVYKNAKLNIVSKTNTHNDAVKHVGEVKYKDAQLTLESNVVATAMGKSINNKAELGLSRHMAILRIETQADDAKQRAYSLVTGSLNLNGLEFSSEGSLTFAAGRGLHKAFVAIGKNGLVTSGTNSIQCSPMTFEHIYSGIINSSGASLSSKCKAVAKASRGELNIEGKITAAEASWSSDLKGYAHDVTTRNTMNIVMNHGALTFSSNLMGSLKQIKSENSHSLTLTLWTLALRSKTDNFVCEDVHYKHDIKVDIKPFVTSLDVMNDLRFYDIGFNNKGNMELEPFKMDLTGSVKGNYGEEQEIRHTYDINYADMSGTVKCSTSGNIIDAQLSHNCEFEFAGLSSKSICEGRINSKLLHFDSTIRTMALPFSLTIDTVVNGDGEINLYGKHTGQLYSKLLVKAEPLALAYSQDFQASTTHMLKTGESSTSVDNKLHGFLTPSKQSWTLKTKSKVNSHAYNQDINTYNNPERIGVEFSGVLLTNIFNKLSTIREQRSLPEKQEFSVAGFLKYDKKSDCHIIEIPFFESLPVAFQQLKNALVNALESLQQFIIGLHINEVINGFQAKLDQLPLQVHNLMTQMELDNKVDEIKEKLSYMIKEFAVTMDDLEHTMENLKVNFENTVMYAATKTRDLILAIKDYVAKGDFSTALSDVFSQIGNALKVCDEKYKMRNSIIKSINVIEDVIRQIDLQKLTGSIASWLKYFDSEYSILGKIKEKLATLKQAVETFDVNLFFQDLMDYILSRDLLMYIEQLSYKIPTSEIVGVIESANDVIVNWIEEYEIPNKLNAVYFYVRDLFVKYDLDKKFNQLLDKALVLIKDFKIEETLQSLVDNLKAVNVEYIFANMMQFLDRVTSQLKATDFKQSVDELNASISSMIKSLKDFEYSAFVDEANKKIVGLTNYINEQIRTYEMVQKVEAIREFFREIQTSLFKYFEKLKNTKVADVVKKLNNMMNSTAYNDIKMKIQDMLGDMRQRVLNMDIRNEIYIYLHRTSEFYTNMIAYISTQLNRLIEEIHKVVKDHEIINQIKQVTAGVLDAMKIAEIEIPSFIMPLTDLVIPAFTVNMNKLWEISIPAQISVPEFTILSSFTIPAFTIDFEEIKVKMVIIIEQIRELKIPMPEPEEIFGDLTVFYSFELPDLTFPEIRLSEIKLPAIKIPKLNTEDFEITMLPIPEIKIPEVPSEVCIPVFGKLHGEFRLNSPYYSLVTAGAIENSTTVLMTPQFTATLTSQAMSSIEFLDYSLNAVCRLEAPRMKKLLFAENVKATHRAFSIDHEGSLTVTGPSAEAAAKTTAKATTQMYTADLVSNLALKLKSGISASIDSTYSHELNIPTIETSSQAVMTQNLAVKIESGGISLSAETNANGKWSIQDYSDEGVHTNNLEFTITFDSAKLTFGGETNSKTLKMKQTMTAESVILNHIIVKARTETEVPFIKSSVMVLNAEAHVGDLKMTLLASHDAELTGRMSGSIYNSLEFLARPFEIVVDSKNKGNSKISFPLKLTGKVDLQHDLSITLNSKKHHACWAALARFNQYRYHHNLTMENSETDIFLHTSANGEANLDFLTVPLTIPEIRVPYLEIKTSEVKELSLWEHAGFKTLLTTPQQSFDMNLKLHYDKNPDTHSFELDLGPIYSVINENANILQKQFENCRDNIVALLKDSYNQAKLQYVKHKIDTTSQPPRIFTVPGYKVPFLNIEVSAFRAELPAFSYFVPKEVSTPSFKVPAIGFSVPSYTLVLPSLGVPVIHVPEALSELTLPTFRLPVIQNSIMIPAMGNLTYDFSFKSTVVTLNANAGLYNKSDIVARFGASSISVFQILNGKVDGTTSLTKKREIKLATTMSLEHRNVEASHDYSVSLSKRSMEIAVVNIAKINFPFLNVELNQELLANTRAKPNVASKMKMKYTFNIPLMGSVGKGNIDQDLALEALTSYVSLEASTKGKTHITVLGSCNVVGDLENEAIFYLNANGLRSNFKAGLTTNIDEKQVKQKRSHVNNIFQFDMNKSFALEISLRHVYAKLDFSSNNNANFAVLTTNGQYVVKGTLDFVPLEIRKATVDIDASQLSSLGHAGLFQNINLAITSEKQYFTWSAKEQLSSVIQSCDFLVSNDDSEIRMELSGSMEGYLAFLRSIKLPVYQRTLWDVLKFDEFTNLDQHQFFNVSSSLVYTKATDGYEFAIPSKFLENGVTFSIPEITLAVPTWVKEIPPSIKNIDMRFENIDVPDHFTLPPVISVPAFDLPFTTLHVEPFTVDLKNLNIPKVITTRAFKVMLPVLPVIAVPSYDIETEFFLGKMSFLSFKIPQYEITVSSFTLPKSIMVEKHTTNFHDIANHILNFEIPTITIPEQKIEIPEIALHLPSSVFIPAFGALSTTFKVLSPIYNVTATGTVENKDSSVVTSVKSICTSTMIFLAYDLKATATFGFDNGGISFNGKGNLIHSDINVDWQQVFAQNLRMTRQTSPADTMLRHHTLNVDITSPTFVDTSFRFASRKDGITASVSSPSSGFLGLHLQRRSPSQLYGKLFSRYLSTPETDTDIMTVKATLRNAEKLSLQTSWNLEVLHDMFEGSKERLPAITEAVLKFINKYHTAHFGFDLNRAGMKLKNSVSNVIERAYHEVPVSLNTLQNSIDELRDQGKNIFMKASDSIMSINMQDLRNSINIKAKNLSKRSEQNIMLWLDAITKFSSDTKSVLPGSKEKITGLEIYQWAHRCVAMVIDRVMQRFVDLMVAIGDTISNHIRVTELTIPGTNVTVNGKEIMENLISALHSIQDQIVQLMHSWEGLSVELLLKKVSDLLQICATKAEEVIASLRSENMAIASQIDGFYLEAQNTLQSSKQKIEDIKISLGDFKDLAKSTVQEVYNGINMEHVNKDVEVFINILQSHLYRGINESIGVMEMAAQNTAPYMRVSNKKMDIDIPLPLFWKTFSEWPTTYRE